MELETTNQNTTIEGIMSLFAHAASGTLDPVNLFIGLTKAADNEVRRLREWAIARGCSRKEFDKAARCWRLRTELGIVPQTSSEFIAAYAASRNIRARYDGRLTKPSGGEIFVGDYTSVDLERDAILANERLRAGFDRTLIRSAISAWIADARPARQEEIWAAINDPQASQSDGEWTRFVLALIDTEQVSTAYAVAVIQKLVWQVNGR